MFGRSFASTAAAVCVLVLGGATAASAVDLPASGLPVTPPSLPIDLTLTPPSTGAAPQLPAVPPAAAPAGDGTPVPPALPSPGALSSAPLPGAGGAGVSDSPTDPCAQVTGPAAEQGAPAAGTCPIIPSSDGGADIPICVDIAMVASCKQSASVTTTTVAGSGSDTPAPGGTGSSATDGSGTDAAGSNDATVSPTSVEATAASRRGTGETLPLTGSAVVWLLTIGTALAAAGGALARVARRRFS